MLRCRAGGRTRGSRSSRLLDLCGERIRDILGAGPARRAGCFNSAQNGGRSVLVNGPARRSCLGVRVWSFDMPPVLLRDRAAFRCGRSFLSPPPFPFLVHGAGPSAAGPADMPQLANSALPSIQCKARIAIANWLVVRRRHHDRVSQLSYAASGALGALRSWGARR